MRYTVYRFGRRAIKDTFKDYERARQHVRKSIRAMYPLDSETVKDRCADKVASFNTRWSLSNPSIGDFGFSIKTVSKTK